MTLTNQILNILAEQMTAALVIAGSVFLLGLIFEKPLMKLVEKANLKLEEKKTDKARLVADAVRLQQKADAEKVQKIRDTYNKKLEDTGRISVPYYTHESKIA